MSFNCPMHKKVCFQILLWNCQNRIRKNIDLEENGHKMTWIRIVLSGQAMDLDLNFLDTQWIRMVQKDHGSGSRLYKKTMDLDPDATERHGFGSRWPK